MPPETPAGITPPETEYKAGRPFVFTDPGQLALRIKGYFDKCDPHVELRFVVDGHKAGGEALIAERQELTEQVPYTITGLARHLGVSRDTLQNYRKYSHYSDDIAEDIKQALIVTIADAVQRVEEFNEIGLHHPGRANGIKFNLVNNFNWQDKTIAETRSAKADLDELDDNPDSDREVVAAAATAELAAELDPQTSTEPEIADDSGSTPPQ